MNNGYTRTELRRMAKDIGIKYTDNTNKRDLAVKLGMDLTVKNFPILNRKARSVEVKNQDGTITIYPSMSKAAKALNVLPMSIYKMAVDGVVKIV